jgi:hypothetical protein
VSLAITLAVAMTPWLEYEVYWCSTFLIVGQTQRKNLIIAILNRRRVMDEEQRKLDEQTRKIDRMQNVRAEITTENRGLKQRYFVIVLGR